MGNAARSAPDRAIGAWQPVSCPVGWRFQLQLRIRAIQSGAGADLVRSGRSACLAVLLVSAAVLATFTLARCWRAVLKVMAMPNVHRMAARCTIGIPPRLAAGDKTAFRSGKQATAGG